MATASMRPFGQRLFSDEIVSLRSFRVKGLPSPPPSLKASSLKLGKSQPFATILRSKRSNTATFQDISNEFEDVKRATDMGSPPSALGKSTQNPVKITESEVQVDQNPAERPRTKSRLVRLLTSKFASRSSSSKSPPAQRPFNRVPVVTSAHAKRQRDAALRERGLLPPLKPSKDLSQQEREQDKRIPIVPLERMEPGPQSDDPDVVMSAADLVKQEWEAKNQDVESSQRERLQNFRFGVTPSSSFVEATAPTSATVTPVAEAPNAAGIPEESEDSQPSQAAYPEVSSSVADVSRDSESSQPSQVTVSVSSNAADVSRESESSQPSGTPVLESLNAVDVSKDSDNSQLSRTTVAESPTATDVSKEAESDLSSQISLFESMSLSLKALALITPIPEVPSEIGEYVYPSLPPSPAPSDDSLKSHLSPTSALLSSSVSVESTASPSGASTLRPIHTPATTASPTPRTPALSLTPPAILTTHSDSLPNETPSCHVRIDSFPLEESVSSLMTPSLDGTSHTTNSTTSESMGSMENGKFGNLQVKTVDQGHNIPVIIESPVEETFSNGFVAETIMEEKAEEEVPVSSPRTQRRGLTDPTDVKPDRRKSLNPFKRTAVEIDNSDKASVSKRSVSSSLSSMRRSVVGTLTRKANLEINVNGLKGYNTSHLPPSPTVDRSRSPVPTSPRSPVPVSPRSPSFLNRSRSPPLTSPTSPTIQRRAVAPIMYNRGNILLETCNIEDEESRRMTELAFLG